MLGEAPPGIWPRGGTKFWVGCEAMSQSLAGSFAVAPRAALALGWKPAESLAETLRATSRYYATTTKTP